MKIIVTSIGIRGDIEPFLAIGKNLKEKGHQVICAFPEQFRQMTGNCDLLDFCINYLNSLTLQYSTDTFVRLSLHDIFFTF